MSVRTLTIKEMLELPEGAEVVVAKELGWTRDNGSKIKVGSTLKRSHQVCDDDSSMCFSYTDIEDYDYFSEGEVGVLEEQLVTNAGSIIEETEAKLGIFRPDLETRKVGKIRVELVDDGFPLALREVAKVMTWAQTAKGYKDHDWQNLPNAEIALAAAASRHRTDHIMQRHVDGLLIERCVDHESGLLHKAHEAFGVLAQLELMLRGEFDLPA